jgi:hypothetical protein
MKWPKPLGHAVHLSAAISLCVLFCFFVSHEPARIRRVAFGCTVLTSPSSGPTSSRTSIKGRSSATAHSQPTVSPPRREPRDGPGPSGRRHTRPSATALWPGALHILRPGWELDRSYSERKAGGLSERRARSDCFITVDLEHRSGSSRLSCNDALNVADLPPKSVAHDLSPMRAGSFFGLTLSIRL